MTAGCNYAVKRQGPLHTYNVAVRRQAPRRVFAARTATSLNADFAYDEILETVSRNIVLCPALGSCSWRGCRTNYVSVATAIDNPLWYGSALFKRPMMVRAYPDLPNVFANAVRSYLRGTGDRITLSLRMLSQPFLTLPWSASPLFTSRCACCVQPPSSATSSSACSPRWISAQYFMSLMCMSPKSKFGHTCKSGDSFSYEKTGQRN